MDMPTDQIFVYENGEKRELIGDELRAFLHQRDIDLEESNQRQKAVDAAKQQKADILRRIGITEEELQILLNASQS